ncbi:MAG: hypothetical protein EAX96_10505 [Candidatus Lokiarchaeota archaeon]|nr:hypothetical protein [Candidatus Lokiarchaeota archaeon]
MVESFNYCYICSSSGIDCCNTPHQIIISINEAIKMHKETGLNYSEFVAFVNLGIVQYEDAFKDLLPNGKALAMKRCLKGSCYFCTDNGCTISQIRPIICRVFPVWYDQDIYKSNNSLILFIEERDCLIRKKMQEFVNFEDACKFVGTTEENLKNYFKDFIHEMELFRTYEHLFDTLDINSAFKKIEEELLNQNLIHVDTIMEKVVLQIK